MEPNKNQEVNTSPIQQPATSSMTPSLGAVPASSSVQTQGSAPKTSGKKVIILLALLLLLIVGMAVYILFAKNQLGNTQKTTTENSSSVLPSPTRIPTVAPLEDLEISSPEADLLELDANVKDL